MSVRDLNGSVEKVDTGNWNSRLELEIICRHADGIYSTRLDKITEGINIIGEEKKLKD